MSYCHTCKIYLHPRGAVSHRTGHRNRKERCVIEYTHGDTYVHDYREEKR